MEQKESLLVVRMSFFFHMVSVRDLWGSLSFRLNLLGLKSISWSPEYRNRGLEPFFHKVLGWSMMSVRDHFGWSWF